MEAAGLSRPARLRSRMEGIGYARGLWILAGAGVFLRLAVAVVHRIPLTLSDAQEYNLLAVNLARHGMYGDAVGHPGASIPPGWPVLLGAVYKVFGIHVVAGQLLAALLESGALVCAALIATKLLRPGFALLVVGVLALNPVWIVWSSTLESEHLALFLATAILAIFVRTELSVRSAAAMGLLLGALALSRSEVALCLFAGLLVGYAVRAGVRRGAVLTAVTCAAIALVLAPWTIRNEVRFHEFIPTNTNAGFNFYLGTLSPYYTYTYQWSGLPGGVAPAPASWPAKRQDDYYMRAGERNVRRAPGRWLRFDLIRVREVFFYDDVPAYLADVGQLAWPHKRGAPNLPLENYWHPVNTFWRVLLAAALAGAAWTIARWRRADAAWRAIVVFLVSSVVVKCAFASDTRGHLSLTSEIVLLSGLGAQAVWGAWRQRRATRTPEAA